MPKPAPIPKYCLHKARGVGVVRLCGKDFYLGKYGTAESLERYHRVAAEWVANGRRLVDRGEQLTVIEVMASFVEHARAYYRRPDGTATSEFDNFCQALRLLKKLYGTTAACQFGPAALRAVEQEMIGLGWCRGNINKQVNRIRSFFKWAVGQELIPAAVYQALQCARPLKRGRTDAIESAPVRPVPSEYIEAVKPYVSRQVWAVVELQLVTGARAGELLTMRAVDIDMSAETWAYTPLQHKTAHYGHVRVIYLGPRAQDIVRHFLAGRAVDAWLFSPAEAEAERRARLHTHRKTSTSARGGKYQEGSECPQWCCNPQSSVESTTISGRCSGRFCGPSAVCGSPTIGSIEFFDLAI